jgi:hypothetical protein
MAKRVLPDPTASTRSPRLIPPPPTIPTSMKMQTHEHWALSLEKSEAEHAALITERFVSRDRAGEPILCYFPQILPTNVVEESHRALEKWVEGYGSKPPKDDIRHPEETDLEESFKGRYGLVHIGTWDAQGHPYDDPCISRDTLTTSSTKFSHTYH